MIYKKIALLIIFSFLCVCNLIAQEIDISSFPNTIQKRFKKISRKEAIIFYDRSCSGCLRGTISTTYIFYREKGIANVYIYGWDLTTKKIVYSLRKGSNRDVNSVIDFAIENFDSLSLTQGSQDLYTKYEKFRVNDSISRITLVRGLNIDHGPITYLFIKKGNRSFSSNLSGVIEVKQYFEVRPIIGTFYTLIHEVYSKFSSEKILDR